MRPDVYKKGSGKGRECIAFHYTNPEMVKDLISLIPLQPGDRVLDAGSGKNKVWYNNLPDFVIKYECEIEDGCDFLKWQDRVDWVIGNPPFAIGWKFTDKASQIADKGIAFLMSMRGFNSFTPRRMDIMKNRGFYINKIHIVSDKRWFGRYYFIIFTKAKNDLFSWRIESY